MNWMYVVVGDSKLDDFPEHWAWVRRSLGHTVATAADAWVALRDAEDTYWNDDEAITWPTKPWVRNLERFMTQVDDAGCVAHRSDADVHTGVFAPENGSAHISLSTGAEDVTIRFVRVIRSTEPSAA